MYITDRVYSSSSSSRRTVLPFLMLVCQFLKSTRTALFLWRDIHAK